MKKPRRMFRSQKPQNLQYAGRIDHLKTINGVPVISYEFNPSVDSIAPQALKSMTGIEPDGRPALVLCGRVGTMQHVPPDASTDVCFRCREAVWVARETRVMSEGWKLVCVCRQCISSTEK